MSQIYSRPIIAESSFTGEASAEIPEGYVLIVRDIDCVYGEELGGTIWAYDTGGVQFWGQTFDEGSGVKNWGSWRGRQVIAGPGFFYISTDFECDFRASGYLLSAP